MPHKSTSTDRRLAFILGIIYLVLAAALATMLFKIWPPTPWPSDEDLQTDAALARALGDCDCPLPPPAPGRVSQARSAPTSSPSPATTPAGSPNPSPGNSPAAPASEETTASATETPAPATPQSPSARASAVLASMPIKLFGYCIRTSFDERLLLLVIIAGMLGSFVHGATSLADYIGNDSFNKSWSWFYLLRPVIGMALALVFYFVIRGGFLTTSGGAKDINPYGIAALAGMVGMFSKQATDKLSEVFGTLFRAAAGEGDDKRKDSLQPDQPMVVTNLEPNPVPVGSKDQTITVTGTNFVDGATVYVNDSEQETTFVSSTKLTANVPDELFAVAPPAPHKLKVVDADGNESAAVDLNVA